MERWRWTVEAMPVAALILFVAIFALVLVYVLADRRRGHLDAMAARPLDDGVPAGEGEHHG